MSVDPLRETVLLECHRAIDQAARDGLAMIGNSGIEPTYPPGVELSEREIAALAMLSLTPDLRSALDKIVRDVASRPLFTFFVLADGVADPHLAAGPWLGLDIRAQEDESDGRMWHDDFYESYSQYPDARQPDV